MSANITRWVWRNAPLSTGGGTSGDILRWVWRYASGNVAIGKLCFGTLTMTIPGAILTMSLPSATMSMIVPGATIEFEDCS